MRKAQDNTHIRSPEELMNLYGVDYRAVEGYSGLTDLNKMIFKRFIVNIYNATRTENRAGFVSMGIHWVRQSDFLAKEDSRKYDTMTDRKKATSVAGAVPQ